MDDASTIPSHGSLSRSAANEVSGTSAPPNTSENCPGHPTRDIALAVRAPDSKRWPCAVVPHGGRWWHVDIEPEALMANPPTTSAPPNVVPGCDGHRTEESVRRGHPLAMQHGRYVARLIDGKWWLAHPLAEPQRTSVPPNVVYCTGHASENDALDCRMADTPLRDPAQEYAVVQHGGRWWVVDPAEGRPEPTEQDYLDSAKVASPPLNAAGGCNGHDSPDQARSCALHYRDDNPEGRYEVEGHGGRWWTVYRGQRKWAEATSVPADRVVPPNVAAGCQGHSTEEAAKLCLLRRRHEDPKGRYGVAEHADRRWFVIQMPPEDIEPDMPLRTTPRCVGHGGHEDAEDLRAQHTIPMAQGFVRPVWHAGRWWAVEVERPLDAHPSCHGHTIYQDALNCLSRSGPDDPEDWAIVEHEGGKWWVVEVAPTMEPRTFTATFHDDEPDDTISSPGPRAMYAAGMEWACAQLGHPPHPPQGQSCLCSGTSVTPNEEQPDMSETATNPERPMVEFERHVTLTAGFRTTDDGGAVAILSDPSQSRTKIHVQEFDGDADMEEAVLYLTDRELDGLASAIQWVQRMRRHEAAPEPVESIEPDENDIPF